MKVLLYLEQRVEEDNTSKQMLNNENKALIEFAEDIVNTYSGSLCVMMSGDDRKKSYLREALARGCDEAILLQTDTVEEENGISRSIAKTIRDRYHLILFGYRMLDSTTGYLAAQVAELLDLPYINMADSFEIIPDGVKIRRKEAHRIQEVRCFLPCVLAVGNRENDGRPLTVMNIMQACDREIQTVKTDHPDSVVRSPFTEVRSEALSYRKRKQEIYQTMSLDEEEKDPVISLEEVAEHIIQTMLEKGMEIRVNGEADEKYRCNCGRT